MNRIIKLVIGLLLILGLTSCLTFEENYTFNADGSGEMELVLDFSQLALFIEDDAQKDSLFMLGEAFAEMEPTLADIPGISNVKTIQDRENLRLGIRYSFDDTEALNGALNEILVAESREGPHAFFAKEGNIVRRTYLPANSGITLVDGLVQSFMSEDAEAEQIDFLLGAMKYKMDYQFPGRVKLIYSQGDTEASGDNHDHVTIRSTFSEVVADRDYLSASFVLD